MMSEPEPQPTISHFLSNFSYDATNSSEAQSTLRPTSSEANSSSNSVSCCHDNSGKLIKNDYLHFLVKMSDSC